jgi:hypothetical protein
MKLFEEFKLYENMWELTEAKADIQRLIDFAGQDLADRYEAVKKRFKAPENDLYYWIKNKTVDELEQAVSEVENTKSNTQVKKDLADEGAELVQETPHWKVYHITSFAAAQKYGRDTKWCITGLVDSGDMYWNDYKEQDADFYFLLTAGEYDPRGKDSKYALALYPKERWYDEDEDEWFEDKNPWYEAFDQRDFSVHLEDIPYIDEVKIPGIDLNAHEPRSGRMFECDYCKEGKFEDYLNDTMYGERICNQCSQKVFNDSIKGVAALLPVIAHLANKKDFIADSIMSDYTKEQLVDIVKAWQEVRKQNIIKKYNSQEQDKLESLFANAMLLHDRGITLEMIQGKEPLPDSVTESFEPFKTF